MIKSLTKSNRIKWHYFITRNLNISANKLKSSSFGSNSQIETLDYNKGIFKEVLEEFKVAQIRDYKLITIQRLKTSLKGDYLLKQYNYNLFIMLRELSPNLEWDFIFPSVLRKLPQNFWNDLTTQKNFVDHLIKILNISKREDWKKITIGFIVKHGGEGLIKLYNNSLLQLLQTLYPDQQIDVNTLLNSKSTAEIPNQITKKAKKRRWNDIDYQKNFLIKYANENDIVEKQDWSKVTIKQIVNEGGSTLLNYHGYSLHKSLNFLFPELNWEGNINKDFLGKSISNQQKYLQYMLESLFSDLEVNFKHPRILREKTNNPIEYDFFIPSKSIAIEYQGEFHYSSVFKGRSLVSQQERDKEKKQKSIENKITLIEIPFWWDKSRDQLIVTIQNARNDALREYTIDSSVTAITAWNHNSYKELH